VWEYAAHMSTAYLISASATAVIRLKGVPPTSTNPIINSRSKVASLPWPPKIPPPPVFVTRTSIRNFEFLRYAYSCIALPQTNVGSFVFNPFTKPSVSQIVPTPITLSISWRITSSSVPSFSILLRSAESNSMRPVISKLLPYEAILVRLDKDYPRSPSSLLPSAVIAKLLIVRPANGPP